MNREVGFYYWLNTNWESNLSLNPNFDLRNTPYDVDGYMLVGTIELNTEPTFAGTGASATRGYLYACFSRGPKLTGFTCAYSIGSGTEMLQNKNIGTVETSIFQSYNDFNQVVGVTKNPV